MTSPLLIFCFPIAPVSVFYSFHIVSKETAYILEQHPKAYVTCAIKYYSEDEIDIPAVSNNHYVFSPTFPDFFSAPLTGLFHPNILMIRFPDRLRVVLSSAFIHVWDWEELSQWVWMQVEPTFDYSLGLFH